MTIDTTTTKETTMKPVLITTAHRGVFFGRVLDDSALPQQITLKGARNCLYWDTSVGGFLGLAQSGPGPKCRIGATVEQTTLMDVTSVSVVPDEAAAKWEAAPCVS